MFKIKKVRARHNMVITTANRYSEKLSTESGLLDTSKAGKLKEYQTVLAYGPMVRDMEVGDTVFINPAAYAVLRNVKLHSEDPDVESYGKKQVVGYNFKYVIIDGEVNLLLYDNDIEYIAEGEELPDMEVSMTQEEIEAVKTVAPNLVGAGASLYTPPSGLNKLYVP